MTTSKSRKTATEDKRAEEIIEAKISFANLYAECNAHLRDMDKNRDQLISFYILIIGAFLAAFQQLHQKNLNILLIMSSAVLWMLGFIVLATANEFRLWHTRYSYTAILIVALSRAKKKEFANVYSKLREYAYSKLQLNIPKETNQLPRWFRWYLNRYQHGTEFYTFLAALTITFVPLYVCIYLIITSSIPSIPNVLNEPYNLVIIFSIMGFVIYFSLFNYIFAYKLFSKFSKCPWATWLLYGIDEKLDDILDAMQ